jgi:predicted nucleic acid-binding protein
MAGVRPQERVQRRAFLRSLMYWKTPLEAALQSGEYRYDLARQGIHISTPDALIAATARAHGAVIITDNTRHFPNTATISLR